jgi:hypothetical protein
MTLIRTDPFVPLTSAASGSSGKRGEFQATILSQPGQMHKFQSVESSDDASAAGAAPRTAGCEPRVTVQREGDRVAGIRIQCSCGQVIDLACAYQESAAPKA